MTKPFLLRRDGDVNPFAGWELRTVPDGLLRLRDVKALCGAREDVTAQSSFGGDWDWDWDYWERNYSLGQQGPFSWVWELG